MNRLNQYAQLIAVALFVLGATNTYNTVQIVQATGAADIKDWALSVGPTILASLISGGGFLAGLLDKIKGRASPNTMPILESIKVLIETFNPTIDDGSFSFVFKAGSKQYRCTIQEVTDEPVKGSEAAK